MSSKKRWLPIILVLLCLGLIAGFGGHWYIVGRYVETTDNAYVESKITVMSARVPGYVEQVMVKENQPVKKGDMLFVLNQADYRAQVKKAEAQLSAAQARSKILQEQLDLQQSLIAQAKADTRMADADLGRVQKDLKRYETLDAASASSRQQLDLVQADERKSVAAQQASEARLRAQQKQLGVLEAQSAEVEAAIAQAQAMLKLAQLNLDNTRVRAPFDGVVGNKHIELGRYLQPGIPVLNIVSTRDVYVTANFKETQIEQMHPGLLAKVSVDAYPDMPLQGKVVSLSPASGSRFSLLPPENATGNFSKIVQRIPVRIEFEHPETLQGLLRPGMSVVVDIDTRMTALN